MPYLLDTNVISELRKPKLHGRVISWVRKIPEQSLFISAVTLGEIQAGIEMTRAQQPDKASQIETWLDHVAETDSTCGGRRWAQLMHGRNDHHLEEALIAATVLVHDLTVAARHCGSTSPLMAYGVQSRSPGHRLSEEHGYLTCGLRFVRSSSTKPFVNLSR